MRLRSSAPRAAVVLFSFLLGSGCVATSKRLSPEPKVGYPAGVSPPVEASVVYPGNAPRGAAVADFLLRASERGALWVSTLRLVTRADGVDCVTELLPQSVARSHQATYLNRSELGERRLERRTESIDVPYLRKLDDLESIGRDIEIWTSKHPASCPAEAIDELSVVAGLHGRGVIGVHDGPRILDLTRCAAVEQGAPKRVVADPPVTAFVLGPDAVKPAARVLPGWVGKRVALQLPDRRVVGVLHRFEDGVMLVKNDGGGLTLAAVEDARNISLDVPNPGAPVTLPVDLPFEGRVDPTAEQCGAWKRGSSSPSTL